MFASIVKILQTSQSARQRVAERIEASGTPLGLPDAAFDAPSMVQATLRRWAPDGIGIWGISTEI